MIPISSVLEAREQYFMETKNILEQQQFTLGGNWEYDSGSFDRYIDDAHKVWLRIPFEVVEGTIDSDHAESHTLIKLGTPYVLKHLYKEGNDEQASVRVIGALFDQFQAPTDPDANIEPKWVEQAQQLLHEVEHVFTH